MYKLSENIGRLQIKIMGINLTANSTQEQLKSAVEHRPDLLESGQIVLISNSENNGKKATKDADRESK